ncbi:MAG: stage III sporulation protein AD [Bacillota bacterium]|nr:stage III sporulation protein AD [Bacillota bacterium]
MEIFLYVMLALAVVMASLLLRQLRPELSMILVIAASVAIMIGLLGKMATVIRLVEELAKRANVGTMHMNTLIKIMGIAYVAEYGAQICKDAGENSLASKVELAGKLTILSLSVPVVLVILETLLRIIP